MGNRLRILALLGLASTILSAGCVCRQNKSCPASSSSITALTCRKATGPMLIDGKLDEPCWANAVEVTGFRIAETQGLARTQARVKLLYDDTALYLGGVIEDQDLYADLVGRDQMCWENDVLEIFLWPDEKSPSYYEFQMTPNNATLDLHFAARGARRYQTALPFNSRMRARATVQGTLNIESDKDVGWTGEMAIPFSELKGVIKPAAGSVWRGMVARYDYSVYLPPVKIGGPWWEASASAPLSQFSFHLLEEYNRIVFE